MSFWDHISDLSKKTYGTFHSKKLKMYDEERLTGIIKGMEEILNEVGHNENDFVQREFTHCLHLLQGLQHKEGELSRASSQLYNIQGLRRIELYLARWTIAISDVSMKNLTYIPVC
jgi:hypothetical protein